METEVIRAFAEEFAKNARKTQKRLKWLVIIVVLTIFGLGCLTGKYLL